MYSVLYVDDESELLELGKLFLEQTGQFMVDIVPSTSAALAMMRSKDYDAILSDYLMPGMDGIEFLKKVRTSGSTVPFILFTGRGREEVAIQALNEGADFYVQKGGDPTAQFTELEHKIRQAVQYRRAEASIRDHERREADIINFLPDATFAVDTGGVVIAWNRAMEEMTGIKVAEILGKGNYAYAIAGYHERRPVFIDLVFNEDPALLAKYPLLKRKGRTLVTETTAPFLNNGKEATIWIAAAPLYDTRGTMVGAIESIRDISDRKQAEEALRMSNRKLQLLSGITRHDIRNQLIALRGAVDLIDRDALDQESRELLGIVEKAAESINSQIEFTKEYEHLGMEEPRWQDVTGVFRHATVHLMMYDISLALPEQDYEIFADPLLEKVFYNLLDNALRHGGDVTCIGLSFGETDEGLRIFVRDNGRGVRDEDKPFIFERGFGKNTGLGLFLSREILSITGITIAETGTFGTGAQFEILVPKGGYRILPPEDIPSDKK